MRQGEKPEKHHTHVSSRRHHHRRLSLILPKPYLWFILFDMDKDHIERYLQTPFIM